MIYLIILFIGSLIGFFFGYRRYRVTHDHPLFEALVSAEKRLADFSYVVDKNSEYYFMNESLLNAPKDQLKRDAVLIGIIGQYWGINSMKEKLKVALEVLPYYQSMLSPTEYIKKIPDEVVKNIKKTDSKTLTPQNMTKEQKNTLTDSVFRMKEHLTTLAPLELLAKSEYEFGIKLQEFLGIK